MTAELITLVLRVVVAVAPSWTMWLGVPILLLFSAAVLLCYERCRRRTYIAALEVIRPGMILRDQNRRHREILIVYLPPSRQVENQGKIDTKGSMK